MAGGQRFRMRSALKDGVLHIRLYGRLDTLSAPQLLELFESETKNGEVKKVSLDFEELNYISSAGLRVLLMMHKECGGGIALTGVNQTVDEILVQSGFDSFLEISRAAESGNG